MANKIEPIEELVSTYCAAWGEPDHEKRRALLDTVFSENGKYVDPTASVTGIEALNEHIGRILDQVPGGSIELTSDIDAHHNVLRFTWCFIMPDGARAPCGIDCCTLGDDGKLTSIVGFFERSDRAES